MSGHPGDWDQFDGSYASRVKTLNFKSMHSPLSKSAKYERVGRYYCVATGILMLLISSFGGLLHRHYLIFAAATRDYLEGLVPYGKFYDSLGIKSFYLYAPSSFWIYGPVCYLPASLGNFLYMGSSLFVFFSGLFAFIREARIPYPKAHLGFFFLVISNEVLGSTGGAKLELLSIGLYLWSMTWLLQSKRLFLSGFLMGLVFTWKFQPVPLLGLILLAFLLMNEWKSLTRAALGVLVACLISYLHPFLFFPSAHVLKLYSSWLASINLGIEFGWKDYHAVYQVLYKTFGFPSQPEELAIVSVAGAVLFISLVLLKRKLAFSTREDFLSFCIALGSCYMVLFSPMSQGMAYILATPMVVFAFLRVFSKDRFYSSRIWWGTLIFHWYVTSLNYSDVVPPPLRIGSFPVRPLGFMVLTTLFCLDHFRCSFFSYPKNALSPFSISPKKA